MFRTFNTLARLDLRTGGRSDHLSSNGDFQNTTHISIPIRNSAGQPNPETIVSCGCCSAEISELVLNSRNCITALDDTLTTGRSAKRDVSLTRSEGQWYCLQVVLGVDIRAHFQQ